MTFLTFYLSPIFPGISEKQEQMITKRLRGTHINKQFYDFMLNFPSSYWPQTDDFVNWFYLKNWKVKIYSHYSFFLGLIIQTSFDSDFSISIFSSKTFHFFPQFLHVSFSFISSKLIRCSLLLFAMMTSLKMNLTSRHLQKITCMFPASIRVHHWFLKKHPISPF